VNCTEYLNLVSAVSHTFSKFVLNACNVYVEAQLSICCDMTCESRNSGARVGVHC
jgi:hypothetical protein